MTPAEPLAQTPEPAPAAAFAQVSKTYDGQTFVIRDLSFAVAPGEFLTLLGPSGSGKTTSLMLLAGFEAPSAGEIFLGGQPVSRLPPHKRGLGVVFQNYALFPHMTVAENLAFPLSVRRMTREETQRRVAQALEMVDLSAFAGRLPQQLSGGQQQRVAVARALVFSPSIVLMDEPLGALDKRLREQLQDELRRLHRTLGVTIVYVTHDQGEAMSLSDRIALFNAGRIVQLGPPASLYDEPETPFVASFIGENNCLSVRVLAAESGSARVALPGGEEIVCENPGQLRAGEAGVLCVRPEDLRLGPAADTPNRLTCAIEERVYLGDHARLVLAGPGGLRLVARVNRGADLPQSAGAGVGIGFIPSRARLLKPDTTA